MSATALSPEIDRLISRTVRAAFAKEARTLAGQVRLAALLERAGWKCDAPSRVACGRGAGKRWA